ncbi:MAG: hypothetical protein H7210_11810 [Pyrinomonadaceae bacterium]|nr:hypothetical protein [Phycisphaerales bacterium]
MSALPNNPPPNVSKDAVARSLAEAHRLTDPEITMIFRIEKPGQESNPAEPVKLLEVNPNTTASGIMPVKLMPHAPSGIFFPSVIVEVHPTELEDLKNGNLLLPNGWKVNYDRPL